MKKHLFLLFLAACAAPAKSTQTHQNAVAPAQVTNEQAQAIVYSVLKANFSKDCPNLDCPVSIGLDKKRWTCEPQKEPTAAAGAAAPAAPTASPAAPAAAPAKK